MSTAFSPIETLVTQTELAANLLAKDLRAVPDDKLNVTPGGAARTPISVVLECASVNGRIAAVLAPSETPPADADTEAAFLVSLTTREAVLEYLDKNTAELLTVIRGLDENTLGEMSDMMTARFGRPMNRFQIALLPSFHMFYHDGQVNYIHSLHGDTEMHWTT